MTENNVDLPTWEDGKPVNVGEVAMSLCGPMRIDGIEITGGGWRLWTELPHEQGHDRWRYIIDEGGFDSHPTRDGEPCEFWQEGDPTTPMWVFAPLDLRGTDDRPETSGRD